MKKWLSYSFIGLLVLAALLFAYHFYAANDAERSLDESIQKLTSEAGSGITVGYSSIEVEPFSGDVEFMDVNIVRDRDIQRARSARFDLSYSDFVNIMLWGTEYGLRNINNGSLNLTGAAFTDRRTMTEIKADSLDVSYRGNLWNLIVLGLTRSPARIRHKIDATGSRFSFSHPESGIGQVRADRLDISTHFGRQPAHPDSLGSTLVISGITWSPPPSFRDSYGFFIRGFGYPLDAIPLERADADFQYLANSDSLYLREIRILSELFTTTISGSIKLDNDSLSQSEMKDLVIELHDLSSRFKTFLDQLNKLTGLPLGDGRGEIRLLLEGVFEKPNITFQN